MPVWCRSVRVNSVAVRLQVRVGRRQTIDAYFHLRMAWERVAEEVLLRNVVLRFRKGVETQRLAQVVIDDDDYA